MDRPGCYAECTENLHVLLRSWNTRWEIISALSLPEDVLVQNVTTDGDSQGAKGVKDVKRVLHPLWKVERLADAVHLGQSQFHASNRAVNSYEMFHSKTKKRTTEVFINDLKSRCSVVLKKLLTKFDRNLEKMGCLLPEVLEATVAYYDRNCSMSALCKIVVYNM